MMRARHGCWLLGSTAEVVFGRHSCHAGLLLGMLAAPACQLWHLDAPHCAGAQHCMLARQMRQMVQKARAASCAHTCTVASLTSALSLQLPLSPAAQGTFCIDTVLPYPGRAKGSSNMLLGKRRTLLVTEILLIAQHSCHLAAQQGRGHALAVAAPVGLVAPVDALVA